MVYPYLLSCSILEYTSKERRDVLSKILKVSDETHELVMSLRSGGETADDVIARYMREVKETPIEKVTRELQEFKDFIEKVAARTTEKIASEATPQKVSNRKTAGGGRPAAEVFEQPEDDSDPEKPCCKGVKPCQHWEWLGDTMVWRNTLSSRIRQPQ